MVLEFCFCFCFVACLFVCFFSYLLYQARCWTLKIWLWTWQGPTLKKLTLHQGEMRSNELLVKFRVFSGWGTWAQPHIPGGLSREEVCKCRRLEDERNPSLLLREAEIQVVGLLWFRSQSEQEVVFRFEHGSIQFKSPLSLGQKMGLIKTVNSNKLIVASKKAVMRILRARLSSAGKNATIDQWCLPPVQKQGEGVSHICWPCTAESRLQHSAQRGPVCRAISYSCKIVSDFKGRGAQQHQCGLIIY